MAHFLKKNCSYNWWMAGIRTKDHSSEYTRYRRLSSVLLYDCGDAFRLLKYNEC